MILERFIFFQVHHLSRELLQERTKVKALSEELENPLNVHRWRKLEGSDPSTYEMIQKIQTLQKRLISKTEEVVEKDLLIQVPVFICPSCLVDCHRAHSCTVIHRRKRSSTLN